MLREGVHPKIVQERTGHASIQVTLDTYSRVAPGLQKAAAESFDKLISPQYNETIENGGFPKTIIDKLLTRTPLCEALS